MRPQKQRYFSPLSGRPGDCHRTCIAMVLNMDRDHVPHFMADCPPGLPADDPRSKVAEQAEVDWLAARGLAPVYVPFPGVEPLENLLTQYKLLAGDAAVVLGCTVPSGMNHSVVIHKGKIYNPLAESELGPMKDGYWWLTIYSAGPNWRSPRLWDRARDFFR